ncbi:LacI family DNA-binding transcriptional regulator [Pantoea piersonii]|uniref:LacI family DNA-binding transcriptional regulator n=1 Tax=Pantoea piersonii TaxID=2364647 RepID=UPI0022F15814|nr:LacI family DNA-binding transcriptional regulator [Pantoea piersonii]WBV20660.1 LacI family DNA-binding transcriptional regulator [Pantoea piersonii]
MTTADKPQKQPKANAKAVAALAGVSKWTVSRAFTPGAYVAPETRERIMAAASELGYRPNLLARSLTKKNTHIIAVAIDEVKNPHAMRILDAVTKQLQSKGYLALVLNITADDDYQSVIEMADQLQVDGILFFANTLSSELFEIAHSLHSVPLIQICRNSDDHLNIENINIDGFRAGREIGQLLMAQGYRRFGYMKGPDTDSSHLLRMEGYQDALSAKNFSIDLMLVAGKYNRKAAYQIMKAYLDETSPEHRVEAIFCENDILAIGVLEALHKAGNMRSIAVVGFDGIDEADSPVWDLTTYDQQTEKQVSEAIRRLTGSETEESSEWRQGRLIVRRSHIRH